MWPNAILMVSPRGYRVDYAINPHMIDTSGKLNRVIAALATAQWSALQELYETLGLKVEVLEGDSEFPDMVFCANQTFPFAGSDGKKTILLSNMKNKERRGEVAYFEKWARVRGYRVVPAPEVSFEGGGDAIWNFETNEIFGGYGFRSEQRAYDLVEDLTGRPVHRLQLCDPDFYHLDTCFAVLRGDTAVYVEEAFTAEGVDLLKSKFARLIRLSKPEALKTFAGNCFSINGKDIVLQKCSEEFRRQLTELGFQLHEVETSEFLKAGGSVFCMKQTL
jgi:N-dimethylarginine dimethylaminohydrolase